MTLPLRADTRPVLQQLEKPGNPLSSWVSTPALVPTGQAFWRCVHVQAMDKFDGGDNHSVYVDVIDAAGQRISHPNVNVVFGYGSESLTTIFEKPAWEPGANFVYGAGTSAWCKIGGFPSDTAKDLYSGYGHTSYYVVFQMQNAGQKPVEPEPPPVVVTPPHQTGMVAVPLDTILEVERMLAELTKAVDKLR